MKKTFSLLLSLLLVICASLHVNANISAISDNDSNLSHIIEFEDGGKDYVYIINGIENHCLVPPEGFNPLTASDEELARYCFPPRPNDKTELQHWENNMKHYKSTPEPGTKLSYKVETVDSNAFKLNDTLTSSIRSSSSVYNSDKWSGYMVYSSTSSDTYSQVQGNYTHPTVTAGNSNSRISYGVGIGGVSTTKMVSAGTASDGISNNHYSYIEYTNSSNIKTRRDASITVSPGDAIHTYITFEKENNKFTYYIANNTSGESISGHVPLNSNSYYDGSTAEWIVAKSSTNSSTSNFPNYNSITFSMCSYKYLNNATWYNYTNSSNLYQVIMRGQTNNVLSQPGAPFGGSCFTCTWQNYN